MSTWKHLNPVHLDALKEIGNIGVGNAATALAQMINRKINMEVPKAGIVPTDKVVQLVGNEEEEVACINLKVSGEVPATVIFLLNKGSVFTLINSLLGGSLTGIDQLDEMAVSALLEVGNILTGSLLNALSSISGLNMQPSVPAFAYDMLGAVLSAAFLERGYFEDFVLIIETRLYDEQVDLNGYFFLLPELGALETILKAIGVQA